jgi:hypothetical protein
MNCTTGESKEKQTPYIELSLSNGEYEFTDMLYVTPKTLGRLCLVAIRVCGMPRTEQLPDDDAQASRHVANIIIKSAIGKKAIVTIEENDEKFMSQSGPDAGRIITKKRKRVAFQGYEEYKESPIEGDMQEPQDEKLPF